MEKIIQTIAQTILESDAIFKKLIENEQKLPQTTPAVEIDIGCQKTIQITKIYTLLLLAEKFSEPDGELDLLTVKKEINNILKLIHPEIKTGIIKLIERDVGKHLTVEYIPFMFNLKTE